MPLFVSCSFFFNIICLPHKSGKLSKYLPGLKCQFLPFLCFYFSSCRWSRFLISYTVVRGDIPNYGFLLIKFRKKLFKQFCWAILSFCFLFPSQRMECWGALNTWNMFKALRHYIAQKVPLVQLHLKDALINHRVSLNLPYNPVIGVLSLTQVCFTGPIRANQLFCPWLYGLHIAVSVTNFPGHTWVIW